MRIGGGGEWRKKYDATNPMTLECRLSYSAYIYVVRYIYEISQVNKEDSVNWSSTLLGQSSPRFSINVKLHKIIVKIK